MPVVQDVLPPAATQELIAEMAAKQGKPVVQPEVINADAPVYTSLIDLAAEKRFIEKLFTKREDLVVRLRATMQFRNATNGGTIDAMTAELKQLDIDLSVFVAVLCRLRGAK